MSEYKKSFVLYSSIIDSVTIIIQLTNLGDFPPPTYTKKAYQKLQEQNGAAKKDYANANMQTGQIVLSTVWAGVVFYFAYYFITGLAEGKWGKAEGTDILHGNLWNLPF